MEIKDGLKQVVLDGHNVAKTKLPQIEVNELIRLALQVLEGEVTLMKAAEQLQAKYQKGIELYMEVLAKNVLNNGINMIIDSDSHLDIGNELGDLLMANANKLGQIVSAYCERKINELDFINLFKNIRINVLNELKFYIPKVENTSPNVNYEKLCHPILGAMAFAKAYDILNDSLEQAHLVREERLLFEQECYRNIQEIKRYHNEMLQMVENYLSLHMKTFQQGFNAMEKGILTHNVQEYISGNVAIQTVLNYDVQFRNEEEFNDLMDSDEAFKL